MQGGECVSEIYWGDGFCDNEESAARHGFSLDCEELGFDHGDCSDDCPDGMIESCTGECTSAMYHGDGVCDDEAATTGLHLNCEALWYDLGDCETVGECASHEDCRDPDSRAEPTYCNAQEKCQQCHHVTATMCDAFGGGDCCSAEFISICGDQAECERLPVCADNEVLSCAGLCAPANFIGDGVCDGGRIGSHHLDCRYEYQILTEILGKFDGYFAILWHI